jgi:hypothetical protein
MSDLESEIRRLTLRPPGDGLDARVFAALQAPAAISNCSEDAQKSSSAADLTKSLQSSRKGVVVTSGWIVAVASMITGIMVGRMMPPLVPHGRDQSLSAASQEFAAGPSGQDPDRQQIASELAETR